MQQESRHPNISSNLTSTAQRCCGVKTREVKVEPTVWMSATSTCKHVRSNSTNVYRILYMYSVFSLVLTAIVSIKNVFCNKG